MSNSSSSIAGAWSKLVSVCRNDSAKLDDYGRRFVLSGIRKGTLSEAELDALRSQGLPETSYRIGQELLAVKDLDPDLFEEELKRLETQTKTSSISTTSSVQLSTSEHPKIEGFRIDCVLGEGAQATAYRALEIPTGRIVAVKVLHRVEKKTLESFEQEVKTLIAMRHDSVLQIVSWRKAPVPCIITEFIDGGDLRKLLNDRHGLDWVREGRKMIFQIADGIRYIHSKGIVHRDLKSDNIFISSSNEPKIGDFGLVKQMMDESGASLIGASVTGFGTGVGTPMYMAPEVLAGQFHKASDVWAFGLIVWEVLSGQIPFCDLLARSENSLAKFINQLRLVQEKHAKSSKWSLLSFDEEWPVEAIKILQSCTRSKYNDRWTMEMVVLQMK
jgi:serine/threonine protein kinase